MKKIIAGCLMLALLSSSVLCGCGKVDESDPVTADPSSSASDDLEAGRDTADSTAGNIITDRPAEEWNSASVCDVTYIFGVKLKPSMTLKDFGDNITVDPDSVKYPRIGCEGNLKMNGKLIGTFTIETPVEADQFMDAPLTKLSLESTKPKKDSSPVSINGAVFGSDTDELEKCLYFCEPLLPREEADGSNSYSVKYDEFYMSADEKNGKFNYFFIMFKNKQQTDKS